MRNNKQRGFTLVELLVVIAILAILATVSVVGYTSFIERADVSVDEQLAAQLNNFTVALKADSNGDYYGVEITPENVREITAYILKDGGLDELNPQSAKHGYDFYYNFSTGKYEVVKTDVATGAVSPLMRLLANAETSDGELDLNPATCFTAKDENGKPLYAYVATAGSDLADAITGFEKFVGKESDTDSYDIDDFNAFCTLVDSLGYDELSNLLDVSVFATNGGNFAVDANGDHVALFIHSDITEMSNTKVGADGESVDLSINNPLVTISANKTYRFPEGVTFNTNSLYINVLNNAKVVFDIDANDWDNMYAFFTGENVTLKLNDNKEYILKSGYDVQLNDVHETYLPFTGSSDFTMAGKEVANKHLNNNGAEESYISYDINGFEIFVTSNTEYPAIVDWSVPAAYADYVEYDSTTGKFYFKDVTVNTDFPSTIKVLATPVETIDKETGKKPYEDENLQKEYTIQVGIVEDVAMEIDGRTYNSANTLKTMTLLYSDSKKAFDVVIDRYDFIRSDACDNLVMDDVLTITSSSDMIAYENGKLVLTDKFDSATFESAVLTISVGGFKKTLTIALDEYADNVSAGVANNGNVHTVGNNNGKATPTVGHFFTNIPEGAKLHIYTGSYNGYDYDLSARTEPKVIENVTSSTQITSLTTTGTYCLVLVQDETVNGTTVTKRISDDFDIEVVDGHNIDDWVDIKGTYNYHKYGWKDSYKQDGVATGYKGDLGMVTMDEELFTITSDIVFLADIDLEKYDTLIVSNASIYGNGFEFDVTNGVNSNFWGDYSRNGIICLENGDLNDIKIVGAVYPEFSASVSLTYGTSVVVSNKGTNNIVNSYIANCRSCVRTNNSVLNIKDSVLYGGRYANIDMIVGTVNLQGTVVTDNRYTTANNKGVMGAGIAGWFNVSGGTQTVNLEKYATFKQYNFVKNDTTIMGAFPTISAGTFNFNPSATFNEMFRKEGNEYVYADYIFFDDAGVAYVNSGVMVIDKYNNNDPKYYADGYGSDGVDERTLTMTANGLRESNYINTEYILDFGEENYSEDLHSKGIYTHKLPIDIWTLSGSNEANQKLFEEYLATLDGGEYEDYYGTDYEFVNGRVHFFTLP